jgi:hypothetical protein
MVKFPTPSSPATRLNVTKISGIVHCFRCLPYNILYFLLLPSSAFIISRVAEAWAFQTAHSRELHIFSSASYLGDVHFQRFLRIFRLVFCIVLDVFCFWKSGTSSVTALAITPTLVCGTAYHMPRVLFFLSNSSYHEVT